jgi:hypothetical protein
LVSIWCASCLLLDLPDPVHGATKSPNISFVPVSRHLSRETTSEQVQAPLRSSTVECTHRSDFSQDKILSPTEPIPNNHRFSLPSQIHSVLQTTKTNTQTTHSTNRFPKLSGDHSTCVPHSHTENPPATLKLRIHITRSLPKTLNRLLSTQD